MVAASCGEEALVPPTVCHPTRTPPKLVYVRAPPSTAAFHERSGRPRLPCSSDCGMPDWKSGVEKSTLRPPPVAMRSQSSFHTASVRPAPVVKFRYGAAQVLKSPPWFRQSQKVWADTCGSHVHPY